MKTAFGTFPNNGKDSLSPPPPPPPKTSFEKSLTTCWTSRRKLDWFSFRRLGLQGSDSDIASGLGP